jgi:hypothetical protein
MSPLPTPHILEMIGPQYVPLETLPLDGCTWELLAGSPLLSGLGGAASIQIPAGAKSVLIESMSAEVRFRAGTAATVTAAAPTADVINGAAPGWLPAMASSTYGFIDWAGIPTATHLALKSAGGVRLTWFA